MSADGDLQVEHGVQVWVLHFLSDAGADDVNFFLFVAKILREEFKSKSFEAFHYLEVIPRADLFLCKELVFVQVWKRTWDLPR